MFACSRRMFTSLLGGAALALTCAAGVPAAAQVKNLELIAPANPGGGWDQTARAMQSALQQAGLASSVQVQNIAGAGGTVGLAQFVTSKKRRGDAILVAGQTLQGAIITHKSPVTLNDITPVARLVGEYEILFVPTNSPITSLGDLVAKLKSDPGSVSWGGGSIASTDHIIAGLIAKTVGVDPAKINYIAHSGGGEALGAILGGHVTVGIGGYGEYQSLITDGKARALAISSEQRLPGVDIPTLKEQGVDVAFFNWRGLMAPLGIRDADRKALEDAIAKMVASPAWKETVAKRQWTDLYQPADQFAAFIKEDRAKMEGILTDLGLAK
ncbi:C4-dicarboxylate ABC transporter substrate-binding protein (plasmid) [Azospirillum brasilense]|uniref:C4-dicarboxylate ABC transporter substrate-binding protein n=2 Tax=Azospirillum brasilense TaxID=192 RepID=A0A235HCX1_AZOBR|nr:tripartite tricarboxylate transporter substrate-binding protein [Azospirillum brasilense]OYD83608.1 C4-dicarboxylate ABC transporter substrate-binding protein [Azospirillum brasilense]